MDFLRRARNRSSLSQRGLAKLAGISYKTLQSLETEEHPPNWSTLEKVITALGHPPRSLTRAVRELLRARGESLREISRRISEGEEDSWKTWLFNFVDAYRKNPHAGLADDAPVPGISPRMLCLLASTVERLCEETRAPVPWWTAGARPLPEPWFVAGIESLKAFSLVESPAAFRKRNIFVFGNFLDRA